nr:hypothetical protein [Tanacetum cinerariifolium]
EEEIAKINEPEDTESGGDDEEVTESDMEDKEEEIRQEEEKSFDPIPRTPEETIPGIVHQYMTQQMTEAVREAVQIQTD